MFKTFETELAGRKLVVETGKMAQLSNGSCLVRYGETVTLVNATMSSNPREGIDFLPLSIDYEERLYAVGKIPGSFLKREGRPSDKAVLIGRAIDRPIRPLFPKDFRNDVSVHITAMSVEPDNLPDVPAMIGSAIALAISDIPFGGPTASVMVGYTYEEGIIINPNLEQREKTLLELTVAGTFDKVTMIEAGAKEIPDDLMLDAIKKAHEEIKKICEFISKIQSEIGKEKSTYISFAISKEMYDEVNELVGDLVYNGLQTTDKKIRDKNMSEVNSKVAEYYTKKLGEEGYAKIKKQLAEVMYNVEKKLVRKMVIKEGKRVDGRGFEEIRLLSCEVSVLPRTHGSALFNRGQTQVLSVVTLGAVGDEQELDGLDEETSKRYIHHYNFPSYSVGEARPSRGPGRREIGHGALAERALLPVIPSKEEFPYTIRVVSEVLSSNGSTSQGSVCGSTLALMDAGVPITNPVAGISTGLFTEDDGTYTMVTDIQGIEDFFGDMDFKVAGTQNGITAIQVDIKNDGLTYEIIEEAFTKTNKARMYILNEIMLKCINKPNENLSKYAPKIKTITINPDKIREVIGPGGKMINKIIEETGVKIDIEDNGTVFVGGLDQEMINKAIDMIMAIAADVEEGKTYDGEVTRILAFGALVEVLPGKEGLLHISKISKERVEKVEDVISLGQEVRVKVLDIDKESNKFNLTMVNVD